MDMWVLIIIIYIILFGLKFFFSYIILIIGVGILHTSIIIIKQFHEYFIEMRNDTVIINAQ